MKSLTIQNAVLVSAVKKASVALKDSFILTVSTNEVGSGYVQSSLLCCNGVAQSVIYLPVKADADAAGEYVFDRLFQQIVNTLAASSDADFIIERKNGTCSISCGNATVPIPMLEKGSMAEPKNPENATIVNVKAEQLKHVVKHGGNAFSATIGGNLDVLRDAVSLAVEGEGKDAKIRIMSSDSVMMSGASASVVVMNGKPIDVTVCASLMHSVTEMVKGDAEGNVVLYLMNEQVMIQDGVDVYLILPKSHKFPEKVFAFLSAEKACNYSFKASKRDILNACSIAALSVATPGKYQRVVVDLSDGKLTLSSIDGSCRIKVNAAEVSGDVRLAFDIAHMKTLLTALKEDVVFYGISEAQPIYINDSDDSYLSLLAPARIEVSTEEEDASEEA